MVGETSISPELQKVKEALEKAKRVAVFTHQRPDPDALGSQAAAGLILKRRGAEKVVLVQFDEVPALYTFLLEGAKAEGVEVAMFSEEWAKDAEAGFDAFLVVDTAVYSQMEPAAELLKRARDKVMVIDHHATGEDLSGNMFVDVTASACVELVAELAWGQVELNPQLAEPLLAGLVADTGWFRFDNVTPRSFWLAMDLVDAGAEPARLYERLEQNDTKEKLALLQRALGTIIWRAEGRVAVMKLTQKDIVETKASANQTEGIVNVPMDVGTVEVAALLTEMPDGRIRASVRSKHGVDVNAVCNQFGGGGHVKAAGCKLDGPIDAARGRLLKAMEKAVREQAAGPAVAAPETPAGQ